MHPSVRIGVRGCVKDNDNITSVGHHIGISNLWEEKYGHTYERVGVCGCARVKPFFIQKKAPYFCGFAISSPLLIYSYHKFEIFSLKQVECRPDLREGPKSSFFGVPNLWRNFSRIGIIAILFTFHYKFTNLVQ